MTRRTRFLAAWLAFLAIILQSAWPLLAQAKPASVALVPLCSVAGVTHYIELPLGKGAAHEPPPGVHAGHCTFCGLSGDRHMAVSFRTDTAAPGSRAFGAPSRRGSAFHPTLLSTNARPRAPPAAR